MTETQDFDHWEDLPSFCGPRISPRLRVRRTVERQNREEEAARMRDIRAWSQDWRFLVSVHGGMENVQSEDPYLRSLVARDMFIDGLRKILFCNNGKRGDKNA